LWRATVVACNRSRLEQFWRAIVQLSRQLSSGRSTDTVGTLGAFRGEPTRLCAPATLAAGRLKILPGDAICSQVRPTRDRFALGSGCRVVRMPRDQFAQQRGLAQTLLSHAACSARRLPQRTQRETLKLAIESIKGPQQAALRGSTPRLTMWIAGLVGRGRLRRRAMQVARCSPRGAQSHESDCVGLAPMGGWRPAGSMPCPPLPERLGHRRRGGVA